MHPSAKIVADSINERGYRLTTMEVVMHRFVLAEFNTHRAFSRNSASSRAIPFKKQIERLHEHGHISPAYPLSWPKEQKGMQGGDEITDTGILHAIQDIWDDAAEGAIGYAKELADLGVHKSVINRLLEPFMWHVVVVTSTDWENFFRQRCSPLAQPEIRAAAEAMHAALRGSIPEKLMDEEWHLPYIDNEDREWAAYRYPDRKLGASTYPNLCAISAARCARVSYLTQDGKRDPIEDLKLYDRLIVADPPHMSPLEHVAQPTEHMAISGGNFRGWTQLRTMLWGRTL